MMVRDERNDSDTWLATLPPTSGQRRLALAVGAVLLVGFGIVAPFADRPLSRIDAFIPLFESMVFVTDLITSVLLFSQYSISRSRALLALASGYLFTALIIIPHVLTYPGVFSPTGLLGAGLQSTVWLYWFWHFGFPAALLIYALLNDEKHSKGLHQVSTRAAVGLSVALVSCLVFGMTLLSTAGDKFLPRLFLDSTHVSPLGNYVGVFASVTCIGAFAMLWARRRSVLDEWLLVVALAAILEIVLTGVLVSARFTLGFYAARLFTLVTSTTVLAVLLTETTRVYARLARSNLMLQREQMNKLMNMEAMAASISHEVNQPLAAIATWGEAALRFLEHTPPNLEEVRSSLHQVVSGSHRASQVLGSLRALFGKADPVHEPVDVNEVVAGALSALRKELMAHELTTHVDLTRDLPLV